MASIYLPPIARKKKVEGWPREDTTRVFADLQVDSKQEVSSYDSHYIRHNVPPTPMRALSANRKNKPQPTAVTFLRQNPRFVCEPICHVDTIISKEKTPHPWWPNETVERPVTQPQYSFSSTSRADYRYINLYNPLRGYSHCGHNLNTSRNRAAVGIVPGYYSTLGEAPSITEKISYEHQYNSRLDPNHPIRGKRHGCFVWKVVSPPRKSHGRSIKSSTNSAPDQKGLSYELTVAATNTTDNNSDVKSTNSSIPDKVSSNLRQENESTCILNNAKLEADDHTVPSSKNGAWGSTPDSPKETNLCIQQPDITQQPQDTSSTSCDDEHPQEIHRPSRPAPHSPPPHAL